MTATDQTFEGRGGQTATGTAGPITVTGLQNGDTYTFVVSATNSNGIGPLSAPTNAVTPLGPPTAPNGSGPIAAGTNAQATVSFTPPTFTGGSPITGYTVTATDVTNPTSGGQTGAATSSPITVTGLTNGDTYTFAVTATNAQGTGVPSAASNPVVPAAPPAPPQSVVAGASNASASISFVPGPSGGAPVANYTVTATDHTNPANGGQQQSGVISPLTVTGLANGDSYTFTVTATNSAGTSPPSAPSNAVTPKVVPAITSMSETEGPTAGGQNLTITGTGLTGTTSVHFGTATVSSYQVVTDTQITATTPAHSAAAVNVTVTGPSGTSPTNAASRYTYLAPPTVTAISPSSGPAAGGTVVKITGTGFATGAAVKFGGVAATSLKRVSGTAIKATSPPGTAGSTVDITVTTAGGTSTTSSVDKFQY